MGPGLLRYRFRNSWCLTLSAWVSVFGAPVGIMVLFSEAAKVVRVPLSGVPLA